MDYSTTKRILLILTTIWCIFLFPVALMAILAKEGLATFGTNHALTWSILYYNIVLYPFVLILSIGGSWFSLKYKRFKISLAFGFLPLLNVLVEIIVADIILLVA